MRKLIVIDSGVDGSGKATQAAMLFEKLNKEYNVRKLSFPNYNTKSCGPVEMYLSGEFGSNPEDIDPYTASTFYAIDRYASFVTDWKKDYENSIIISDRYVTSNLIHQGSKLQNKDMIDEYCDWVTNLEYNKNKIPKPDLVIFLDVPVEFSLELMKNRKNKINGESKKDIHESSEEHLRKSYNNSMYICEKYKWEKISCIKDNKMRSIEEISEEIFKIVNDVI